MSDIFNHPSFALIAMAVALGIFLLAVIAVSMARFYRRCGADEALVRTGSGGNKVVIGGGTVVYPILHQLLRVSLRSIKLSVERSASRSVPQSQQQQNGLACRTTASTSSLQIGSTARGTISAMVARRSQIYRPAVCCRS